MDCSTPGFSILHHLPELPQTHVHWVGDAIQPSHLLSSPFPPSCYLSQHQGLFQWVSSLHQVAKVLEFQHQSFQWMFRVDFLQGWLVWSPCSPRDSCPTRSQNPSHWDPSWLSNVCPTRKDPESEWLDKHNLETNPMTIKPKIVSHLAEQSSWVPLASCSPPRRPFPKSLLLCQHMCLLRQFISDC